MSAPTLKDNWQYQLQGLGPNWNLDGSTRITEEAISAVERIATVPRSDGGIQVETHQDGWDIEIEYSPGGNITSVLVCREDLMGKEEKMQ